MHCDEKKNSLIDSFKDKAIFHVILEIDRQFGANFGAKIVKNAKNI